MIINQNIDTRRAKLSEVQSNKEYDVVFSFAGVQREYVEKVRNELSKYKVSVFYDNDSIVDLWGKNLYLYLAEMYSQKARYCVIFISKEYQEHPWTIHEFQFASERVFDSYGKQDMPEYILPVIFDDTIIPGLPKSIGYIDARKEPPEKLAEYIAIKVGKYNEESKIEQNVGSLFEYIELTLNNYAKKNVDIQVLKENSVISLVYTLAEQPKYIVTFHLFEEYINLYLGEFLLGINPNAIFFIDDGCQTSPIKLINFSPFFKRIPEQNLGLKEFDMFLNNIISTMPEVIA